MGSTSDEIAGTSSGALVGALYAEGKDASQLRELAMSWGKRRWPYLTDFTLPRTGFFEGRKVKEWLRSIMGDVDFGDLGVPFACVATDIQTGEEVVLNRGSVVEAVRASISAPVIFSLVKWQGRYLVDGALVNPVPVNIVREMGAEFIIAVNVIPNMEARVHGVSREPIESFREPNIFSIMMRTIYISGYQVVETSLRGADVVVKPQVAHIGFGDMRRVRECILQGELATQESIPEIKKQLAAA